MNGFLDGIQCTLCNEVVGCMVFVMCMFIGDIGSWCVFFCEGDEDCSDGFSCTILGDGLKCVLMVGFISVNCEISCCYFFGSNFVFGM